MRNNMPTYIAEFVYSRDRQNFIRQPIEFHTAKEFVQMHEKVVNAELKGFIGYNIICVKKLKTGFLTKGEVCEENVEELMGLQLR